MRHQSDLLIGASQAIRVILEDVEYAARTDAKILITGESGVGKEVVARLVHSSSRRSNARFVTINCAGVPESLLESELFGHARGSFTGAYRDRVGSLELACGGTLFLDEVGEMSLRMQALLLRFLETGEIQRVGSEGRDKSVDARLITATNRNLLSRIGEGAFREDLYYRLNVIHIIVPPLREHREDVAPLARHFLAGFATSYRVPLPSVAPEALERLTAYGWPGNVRELRNVCERLAIRVHGRQIEVADLPPEIVHGSRPKVERRTMARERVDELFERMVAQGAPFWTAVHEPFLERDLTRDDIRALVARGLEATRGSYTHLTALFNIDRADYKKFLNFLHKHGCHLPVARFRNGEARSKYPSAMYPPAVVTDRGE
jgi:DNA-binding NtrC family response regulator